MNDYSIALFLHVVGALGFVVALGLEWTSLRQLLHDPLLSISLQIRVAIALGIVFLMTVKPDLTGSLLAIVIAAMLGLASALPMLRRERAQAEANQTGHQFHHT